MRQGNKVGLIGRTSDRIALHLAACLRVAGLHSMAHSIDPVSRNKSQDWLVSRRKVRVATGGIVRGSAFHPSDDWAGSSRQVRRWALRALNFTRVSRQFLLMPRRGRRLLARQMAVAQYREAQVGMQP